MTKKKEETAQDSYNNTPIISEERANSFEDNARLNRVLEGTLYYPCVHTPNYAGAKKFNQPPKFSVLVGLDEANLEKARDFGLKIKEPNDNVPMPHVEIKQYVKHNKKTERENLSDEELVEFCRPTVVDSAQKVVPKNILIGNGSKGIVKFTTYFHFSSEQHGMGTGLRKIQVTDLVTYEKSVDDTFIMDEERSFVDDMSSPHQADESQEKTSTSKVSSSGDSKGSIFDDDD